MLSAVSGRGRVRLCCALLILACHVAAAADYCCSCCCCCCCCCCRCRRCCCCRCRRCRRCRCCHRCRRCPALPLAAAVACTLSLGTCLGCSHVGALCVWQAPAVGPCAMFAASCCEDPVGKAAISMTQARQGSDRPAADDRVETENMNASLKHWELTASGDVALCVQVPQQLQLVSGLRGLASPSCYGSAQCTL